MRVIFHTVLSVAMVVNAVMIAIGCTPLDGEELASVREPGAVVPEVIDGYNVAELMAAADPLFVETVRLHARRLGGHEEALVADYLVIRAKGEAAMDQSGGCPDPCADDPSFDHCGGLAYREEICHCGASTCGTWSTAATCGSGPQSYYQGACTGGNYQQRGLRDVDVWFPNANACGHDVFSLGCGTPPADPPFHYRDTPHPDYPPTTSSGSGQIFRCD